MMDKDKLQILSTLIVTLALVAFVFALVDKAISLADSSDRVSPETVVVGIMGFANLILMAVVARWLQQGAQQSAERTAEKLQQAVSTAAATSTNGTTQVAEMNVESEKTTIAPGAGR